MTASEASQASKIPDKDSLAEDIPFSDTLEMKGYALSYAQQGMNIFPVHNIKDGFCSCRGSLKCKPGKHPRTSNGLSAATSDLHQVEEWWTKWPDANIGCRPHENEIVLDIEKEGLNNGLLGRLIKQFGPLPVGRISATGGGGIHLFFTLPEGAPEIKSSAKVFDGMDIRTVKGYVILPPSNHVSGNSYSWKKEGGAKIPELPMEWCVGIAQAQAKGVRQNTKDIREKYTEGNRNHSMFEMACAAIGKGKTPQEVLIELRRENKRLCSPPLPDAELKMITESAAKYGPNKQAMQEEELEQIRIARLQNLVTGELNSQKIDHVALMRACNEVNRLRKLREQKEQYAAYAKGVYATGPAAVNEIVKTVKRLLEDYKEALDWDVQKLFTNRAKTEFWNQVQLEAISTEITEWDKDDYLLNVYNGVLDLKTRELLPHSPDYLMTKQATVAYHKNAKCPWWEKVIARQLGTGDKARYFQALCGRLLTGDMNEKAFYLLVGPTDTGKSVILGAVASLLGSYAARASRETFIETYHENPRWEIASWIGKRLVHVQEFKPADYWFEPLLKDWTGGEPITAAKKHMHETTFQPKGKIVMATNNIPRSRSMDGAFENRVRIIPFNNQIPKTEQDYNLPQRFIGEHSGILNWMLAGIDIIEEIGLGVPDWMMDNIDFYKVETDPLNNFAQNCIENAKNDEIRASELYQYYVTYMGMLGENAVNLTNFGNCMKDKGYQKKEYNNGYRYVNIRTKPKADWLGEGTQASLEEGKV
jgi:putative DNA primase/helicase